MTFKLTIENEIPFSEMRHPRANQNLATGTLPAGTEITQWSHGAAEDFDPSTGRSDGYHIRVTTNQDGYVYTVRLEDLPISAEEKRALTHY